MGRQSSIDKLPQDVRDALIAWLEDPAISYDTATEQVNNLLKERGLEPVSRSAVSRKGQRHREDIERIGKEMREAKASREFFYKQFGDDLAEGGKFLIETLQGFMFKMNLVLNRVNDTELTPEDVYGYSKTIKNLTGSILQTENALSAYTKREEAIKRQALQEAAEVVDKSLTQAGATAEMINTIKADMLNLNVEATS